MRWKRRRDLEPAALLAATVAHHFDDWRVDEHTAHFTVDGVDAAITCAVPEDARDRRLLDGDAVPVGHRRRARGRAGVRLRQRLWGDFRRGDRHRRVQLGRARFGAALAREESFETTLDRRRFEVGIDGYDRVMGTVPIDDPRHR